jgi:hypothetical protein
MWLGHYFYFAHHAPSPLLIILWREYFTKCPSWEWCEIQTQHSAKNVAAYLLSHPLCLLLMTILWNLILVSITWSIVFGLCSISTEHRLQSDDPETASGLTKVTSTVDPSTCMPKFIFFFLTWSLFSYFFLTTKKPLFLISYFERKFRSGFLDFCTFLAL